MNKSVVVNDEAIRSEPEANSLLAKSDLPGVYLRGRAGEVVILISGAFRATSKIFSEYSSVNSSALLLGSSLGKSESHRTQGIYQTVVWALWTVKLKSFILYNYKSHRTGLLNKSSFKVIGCTDKSNRTGLLNKSP